MAREHFKRGLRGSNNVCPPKIDLAELRLPQQARLQSQWARLNDMAVTWQGWVRAMCRRLEGERASLEKDQQLRDLRQYPGESLKSYMTRFTGLCYRNFGTM